MAGKQSPKFISYHQPQNTLSGNNINSTMSTPKREPDKKKERKKKKKNVVFVSHQRTSCEENKHISIIMKLASSPVKAK
jgi:hypothetical protein